MTTVATSSTDLAASLADLLTGHVLLPGTEAFDAAATPFNLAVSNQHLLAVEAADAADVVTAVRFANQHGVAVSVQATGHGACAVDRPTILVLTHLLDELSIDPVTSSARIGAGVRWERVIEQGAAYGLAGLAGSAPGVGVVGYTTGGGMGPVARTFGWASDRVTAFDVVTGDGVLRRVTASEHPALFWGLRGGKGALGIVTAVEMELVPLTRVFAGALFFAAADMPTVLHAWAAWSADLPSAASTSVAVVRLPPLPGVPPVLSGKVAISVRFAWVGDPTEGERLIAPIAAIAPVVLGGLGVMPYAAMGMIHNDPVDPMPVREDAALLHSLTSDAVETLVGLVGPQAECPQVIVELRLMGGALAQAAEVPSALSHRDAAYSLLTIGLGVPPVVDAVMAHSQALRAAMGPWSTGGNLPNFAASADPAELARKYDAATLARLGTLAATYDPHEVLAASIPFRD